MLFVFKSIMSEKGFETEITLNETPIIRETEEKPLKSEDNQSKKVDINVLKARAQEVQNSENRKNIFIFIIFLLIIGTVGIYLSI
jgi:hypothetical protein